MWIISEIHKDGTIIGKDYESAACCIKPLIDAVASEDVVEVFVGQRSTRQLEIHDKPNYFVIFYWSDGDESITLKSCSYEELEKEIKSMTAQKEYIRLDKRLSRILYYDLRSGKKAFELERVSPFYKGGPQWRKVEDE